MRVVRCRPTMDTSLAEPAPGAAVANAAPRFVDPAPVQPTRLDAETSSLRALVHHAYAIDHDALLEDVQRLFAARRVEFLAVLRAGVVAGVCSRLQLGILLGSRYGFALYGRSQAHLAQVARPLIVSAAAPVREVLQQALARAGDTFHEDIALVEPDGRLVGLIPIDALARLQTQLVAEQLRQLQLQERQLLRQEKQYLLDLLVGGIAHELNNKLTPVQGFSELIAMAGDEETRRYAQHIIKSTTEAAHIIRQLLQLSKPAVMVAESVDLRAVAAEALSMLRFQLREANCAVHHVAPEAPVWVRADPAQMKQVVINLGLNALHAMAERAKPLLTIEVTAAGDRAQLVVADNGVGIAPEHLDRIFDPFFTTKGPERGSGLGLSVSTSIVRQHGGDIAVASAPGEGARFTLTLPRVSGASAAAARPAGSDAPATALPANPEARVLVVEDEPHVRRLIQMVLSTRFGCDVDAVAHGIEAFERLATQRYTLVVSDIRMATMNGTELYLWLREAQPETAQRFIFVTGFPGENHLAHDLPEAKVPVLTKPFSVAQLCDACAPFLGAAVGAAAQQSA